MKRSYIAFVFDVDGYLKPYTKHPLFTGEVAPDCARPAGASGVSPSPMICGKLNVREFEGVGQALAAVSDYQKGITFKTLPNALSSFLKSSRRLYCWNVLL